MSLIECALPEKLMQKLTFALIVAAFATTGCATKDYVHEYVGGQVGPVKKQVDTVEGRTKANETGLEALSRRADGTEAALKTQNEQLSAQIATSSGPPTK